MGCLRSGRVICCATPKVIRYITLRTGPVVVWVETIPCVKGSYLRLDFKGPAHSLPQAEHEKFRRQQTRFNSKPCMIRCHLQLACQQTLCIQIHMLTVISVHTEVSATKKRPEIWSFPLLLRRTDLRTTTRNSAKTKTNICTSCSNTPNHMCKIICARHVMIA